MLQRSPGNSAIAGQSRYYQSSSLSDKRLRALFHSPMLPKSNTHASQWTVPNFFKISRHRTIIDPNLNFRKRQPLTSISTTTQSTTTTATLPSPDTTESPSDDQMLKFLYILNERRPVIASERDTQMIKFYLSELSKIKAVEPSMGNAFVLDMQIDFIGNITEIPIQREVLKIYIKDMVEKSGFLSGVQSSPEDIDALTSLIDSIGNITQRLSNNSVQHVHNNNNTFHPLGSENVGNAAIPVSILEDVRNAASQNALHTPTFEARNLHQLGLLPGKPLELTFGLNAFESKFATNRPLAATSLSVFDPDASRQRLEGVFSNVNAVLENAQHDVTGDVIFGTHTEASITGQRPVSSGLTRLTVIEEVPSTEAISVTPPTSSIAFQEEVVGGSGAYWTHLRTGLTDILCSLCKQQRREACVKRYCNLVNGVING
ncbi:hypothetical protein DPMN_120265 [Dreissena polymorpha]|uniref:Uncharacterized protein n=1 Tax=Dreissena polymorpha TaxID=45954 RepID=A0A9D4GJV9_DREPO|nr:hypothetical protein DPMN_120265 [Dreissena polymorpha]